MFSMQIPKGYSGQNGFLLTLEQWKNAIHNKKVFVALFTDLLKAFDCINHDFLITNLMVMVYFFLQQN